MANPQCGRQLEISSVQKPGLNPFHDWRREVAKDGTRTSWWVMPFRHGCTIKLENVGKQTVEAATAFASELWKWDHSAMSVQKCTNSNHKLKARDTSRCATPLNAPGGFEHGLEIFERYPRL